MLKQKTEKGLKIPLPDDLYLFLGTEVYIGISLKRKRMIVFKRENGENVNINNLIYPSAIKNNCLNVPSEICKYLEWDFSDSLRLYCVSDYIIIEPF